MISINFTNNWLILFVVVLSLGGCSIATETFDCSYGKGVGCHSITSVNAMVNNGNLVGTNAVKSNKLTVKSTANSVKAEIVSSDNMMVKRITEEHLRIWIAPHQDEQGRFHEGAVIHTVLKPGFWQVQ
jgi:hypothetical protein